MADPFRLRVLMALTAALEEITEANGYQHNLENLVFRGRDVFGDSDPLPMVCILEQIEEIDQTPSPSTGVTSTGDWQLQLQGFVEDDWQNPTDPAHRLMADVKRRLVKERARDRARNILGMGGAVTDLHLSHGVVRPPDDISGKAYFWLRIKLKVVENLDDPYL